MTLHALLLATTIVAQMSAGKPGDVVVRGVSDRRSTGSFARLAVTVEMPSVRTWDVAAARVLVTSAVDDVGTNLIEGAEEPRLEMNQRQEFGKDEKTAPPMLLAVEVKNPARAAKTIKELRGSIELYMPSLDRNGSATIAKFLSQSGKNLSDRALKANGVEISMISSAQFETMKKAAAEKYRAQQKAEGLDADFLDRAVENFLEYEYVKPEEGEVLLKVNDPNKRIESISYISKSGEVKRANMNEKQGITVLSTWGEKPEADWSMRINLKTSKNLVRYPFALTNVALP